MSIVVGVICFVAGGLLGVLLSALCAMAAPTPAEQARDDWREIVQCWIELARLKSQVRGALSFLVDGDVAAARYALENAVKED